jgi:hypothetical protein
MGPRIPPVVVRILEIAGLMAACLLGLTIAGYGQSAGATRGVLSVRTYNYFAGVFQPLGAAREQADAILHDAGITVIWVDCTTRPTAGVPVSDCDRPVAPTDLVLRIIAANDPSAHDVALGSSVISRKTGTGFLSTVYADRVLALTRQAGTNAKLLLGRAIAHELGHLLMGTTRHSDAGLMRASWSLTDLQRNHHADWQFLDTQASAMRHAIASRFAVQPGVAFNTRHVPVAHQTRPATTP